MAPAAILLLFVVMPVWTLAGFADWACHRASRIEQTSGLPESLLHIAQLGCVGIPVMVGLFLHINAAVLLFMLAGLVAHHVTAYVDLVYANPLREISPVEQMVHSVLEIAPATAFLLMCVLHWPQVSALARGAGDFTLAWDAGKLPLAYTASFLVSTLLFDLGPYAEEVWRTARHARRA